MYRSRKQKLSEFASVFFFWKSNNHDPRKKKVLIFSNYRSGSTFLQSAIAADEKSLNLHEPFGRAGRNEALKHLTRGLIPKKRWLEGIAEKYLQEEYTIVAASFLTNHLDSELKTFLEFLLKKGWCVIGIIRDPVDIVVSLYTAIASGKWHRTNEERPVPFRTPKSLTLGLGDDIKGTKRLITKIYEYNCQITEASKHLGFPLLSYEKCLKDISNHPHAQQIIQSYYPDLQLDLSSSTIERNPKQEFTPSVNAAIEELRAYYSQLKTNAQS